MAKKAKAKSSRGKAKAKKPAKKAKAKTVAKKVAKKPAAKKAAKPAKKKSARKPNAAFMRPMQPSEQLAAVVGSSPLPRSAVVSKMWDYIRKNRLQDPQNKRNILADDTLQKVFGKREVSMFEMNKHLSKHMS
jgi:chromatin remodeling complex protein RSC6